jgi:hypothetical protein
MMSSIVVLVYPLRTMKLRAAPMICARRAAETSGRSGTGYLLLPVHGTVPVLAQLARIEGTDQVCPSSAHPSIKESAADHSHSPSLLTTSAMGFETVLHCDWLCYSTTLGARWPTRLGNPNQCRGYPDNPLPAQSIRGSESYLLPARDRLQLHSRPPVTLYA